MLRAPGPHHRSKRSIEDDRPTRAGFPHAAAGIGVEPRRIGGLDRRGIHGVPDGIVDERGALLRSDEVHRAFRLLHPGFIGEAILAVDEVEDHPGEDERREDQPEEEEQVPLQPELYPRLGPHFPPPPRLAFAGRRVSRP